MTLSTLSRSLDGSVAIVTGAASGMGRATAHLFADEKARVACVDITPQALGVVVDEITADGGEARAYAVDLSDGEAIKQLIADVARDFGGIDILVNNAGIGAGSPIDADDYESIWDKAFSVLLPAHVRMVRAA